MRGTVLDKLTGGALQRAFVVLALSLWSWLTPGCDCTAGPVAPPGTSSYHCTCECGVFLLGVAVEDRTRLTPRFEACLTPDDVPGNRRLYASDVVRLCDRACEGTISSAVREVGCVDRPDLCAEISCSDDVCKGANIRARDVFVPTRSDAGVSDVPDEALLSFGFAAACHVNGADAALLGCDEVPCALEEVRSVPVCGDGVLQEGEECDGPCNTFDVCAGLAPGTSGYVRCGEDCSYDVSGCVARGEDAGAAPELGDCVEQNEAALQARVIDVLKGCTVVEPAASEGECAQEASSPLCLVP